MGGGWFQQLRDARMVHSRAAVRMKEAAPHGTRGSVSRIPYVTPKQDTAQHVENTTVFEIRLWGRGVYVVGICMSACVCKYRLEYAGNTCDFKSVQPQRPTPGYSFRSQDPLKSWEVFDPSPQGQEGPFLAEG